MDPGAGAKRVASDRRIIRRNRHAGRRAHALTVPGERTEIVVDPAQQLEIHQQLVHRGIADPLADSDSAAMHARRAGADRRQRIDHRQAAIRMAVPVEFD